jgi:hypothetical protein
MGGIFYVACQKLIFISGSYWLVGIAKVSTLP